MLIRIPAQGRLRLAKYFALVLGFTGICGAAGVAPSLRLRAPTSSDESIRIEGKALRECTGDPHLQVFVAQQGGRAISADAVFGRVVWNGSELLFAPAFPFIPGVVYRVALACSWGGNYSSSWFEEFAIPKSKAAHEVPVVKISPSATVLPANTLRFYISFETDMRGRFGERDISLRDEAGQEQKFAFMSFGQELWSADGRKLTLLIDPGRLKRGVTANTVEGPPLSPGRRYVLSIYDRERDTSQPALSAAGFLVVDADRRPLDPRAWKVVLPKSATRDAMLLVFDRVMDGALLMDSVRVRGREGDSVSGTMHSETGERSLRFAPDDPWKTGGYYVEFASQLEDVCGNRIGEALDHEIGAISGEAPTRLDFTIQ